MTQRCPLCFSRNWKECHLRQDRHTLGRLPDDVSSPVLPQAAEHYGKCAEVLASFCSNEGAAGGRVHWRTSCLRGPGMRKIRRAGALKL